MSERRQKLLRSAGLPKNVNDIIQHTFDFHYLIENGTASLSGIVTGVGHCEQPYNDGLELFPSRIFIGDHQVHCFRRQNDKWVAILAPRKAKYQKKWSEKSVEGTLRIM